jgi:hypothetical protein
MPPAEPSPETKNYSHDMESLLSRSASINRYYEEDFDISFSSLFLAFLVNDDLVSQWFQAYVRQTGINIQKILEERGLDQRIMEDIAHAMPSEPRTYRMTNSAKRFLQAADRLYQSSPEPGDALDVRHLMAVFIYDPWVHEKDLIRWGFDRKDLSEKFLELMRSLRPKELGFWREQHRSAFGEESHLAQGPGEVL